MTTLRKKLIRLAHTKPELRPDLLPLLKEAGWPYGDAPSLDSLKYDPETPPPQDLSNMYKFFDVGINMGGTSVWDKPKPDGIDDFIAALKRRDERRAIQLAKKHHREFWDRYPTMFHHFWQQVEELGLGTMPRV